MTEAERREVIGRGKWAIHGVPHKGWVCVDEDDLGEPSAICEMCETMEIRYVHYMRHDNYPETLGCGKICAGHMADDYAGAERRERKMMSRAVRRARWLRRSGWRWSMKGNEFINVDGYNIAVFQHDDGSWGARILDRRTNETTPAQRRYPTSDSAKLAAFDRMMRLKDRR